MRRFSLLLGILMCVFVGIQAQVNEKIEVYEKQNVRDKKPVPYVPVHESNVIWSKTIWRMVDLRHKQNLPLYYPTKPIGNRMSLISLLLYGINNEGINAYAPDAPDASTEFDVLMTKDEVALAMDALPDTVPILDAEGLQTGEFEVMPPDPKTYQVKQLLLKETWFFDKKYSVMKVRLIGICPIRIYMKENGGMVKQKTFWIYYPEVRNLMTNHEIYNRKNDAQRISFEDFFLQRRFDGFIYAESNVYNNRQVNEYTTGLETMLEAEKIEDFIFSMEHDMWVY